MTKEQIEKKLENGVKNPFERRELEGRLRTIEVYPEGEFKFTDGKYTCYDAYTEKNGVKDVLIEIKTRDCNHDTYDTAYFEYGKYCNMRRVMESTGARMMVYISHYKDGVSLMWNVTNLHKLPVVELRLSRTTSGDRTMTTKRMYELPIKLANKRSKDDSNN